MARIDWNKPAFDLPPPGIYHVEVKTCEEKKSGNGNSMFIVKLVDLDRGHVDLVSDNIMLDGGGWSHGKEKLYALNVPTDQEEVLASDLIGLRAYVCIHHEPNKWTKKDGTVVEEVKARVNIKATTPWSGYWADGPEAPAGYKPVEAPF